MRKIEDSNYILMNKTTIMVLILLPFIGAGCTQKPYGRTMGAEDLTGGRIITRGTSFIDSRGRQVIFNGINKVNKDPLLNYTDPDSLGTFEKFGTWGFNCIRLGVIWDGVEPKPGNYDEKYLDKVEEHVNWAAQHGLYILLDMHQDLYGVSFGEGTRMGDGAPAWATITDNQPHVTGQVWSDSYLISPAVQRAFDHFWANTPAADGVGLLDHYAAMWQHVAKRFADNSAVIGYDIMNEPFNGTQGTRILPVILGEYARLYTEETGKILTENEVLAMWTGEEHRFEAISRLNDRKKYSRVFGMARELNTQFEKGPLQAMYQRVSDAIRAVDTMHILFLEHAYFGNAGVPSGIEPVKGRDGKPDPLVAYAAHGYDLLVDTKNYDSQSNSRVEQIFSQIYETSQNIGIPVLVGEWGAFSGNSEALASSAQFITNLFGSYGFGNTYWSYYQGIDRDLYFTSSLVRPYPPFIGGKLNSYGYDYKTGIFRCSWLESRLVRAPTVIYIPDLETLANDSVKIIPKSRNFVFQPIKTSKSGYLIIPVSGDSVVRTVEFRLNQNASAR
jgi:endoglycosylceramidase